ncbi:hypothetical protein BCU84_00335 [Shewanella sp. 10N.286.51.B7]|uniref:hypothetical protein n=1 Tax=Shewanella sp. 10N.286.51.B7 TaxID=1880836 RepID=UPI000C82CC92|nr:hypothetical protein [Shewanella sp. 10N.286.51.B7]PMG80939.1 hypothetical protein BCU84_00335 [Shewanella sp. 10N.286.51.B7]
MDDANKKSRVTTIPKALKVGAGGLIVIAVFILGLYTALFLGTTVSQETFAQFGDYVGGTLNPILSFATIGLLVWSIRIQLDELRETRHEATQSRQAFENQLKLATDESTLNQIQMAIDTYIQERELLLSMKLPQECIHSVSNFLDLNHNIDLKMKSRILQEVANLSYKNCIIPFARVNISESVLLNIKRTDLDEIIYSSLVSSTSSSSTISSCIFMSLQISKSLFDFHEITTYKKNPTAILWKHSSSYLEPLKAFIDRNNAESKLSEFNFDEIRNFYEELEYQIEKVNNLAVDY